MLQPNFSGGSGMIKTFFGAGTLETSGAFLAALIIGVLFGVALEQA